jgi:hypothetical protein
LAFSRAVASRREEVELVRKERSLDAILVAFSDCSGLQNECGGDLRMKKKWREERAGR